MAEIDTTILQGIQYAVLEPPDGGLTWPSGLWTQAEILGYMNTRQSRFLKATGLWIGQANIDVLTAQSRIALPADWISTLSATWRGVDGSVQILERADTFEADHGDPDWEVTYGLPALFMDYEAPTLQLVLTPLPLTSGVVQLLYVPQGPTLTGTGETLQVQPMFAAACAKYGTLADMLAKDGRGKNAEKAAYAESRYQMGIDCARIILDGFV
jgi:hypothetical protein